MKHFNPITILFAAFMITSARAQSTYESRFSIVPSVSSGHTWIRNTSWSPVSINARTNMDPAFQASYSGGISTLFRASQDFGIELGVFYSTEGDASAYEAIRTQLDLHYVRVPLKFTYFFGDSQSSLRPKVSLGATAGFKTWERGMLIDHNNEIPIDVSDAYKNVDYGVNASVGVNQKIYGNISFNADVIYYHGLTGIGKDNGSFHYSPDYNSNIGVQLGLVIGL